MRPVRLVLPRRIQAAKNCPQCGRPMDATIAGWRCPACGHWEPVTLAAVPHTELR
jgi:tRNA(Ile2) C34 agmatinyltransferase TiaS